MQVRKSVYLYILSRCITEVYINTIVGIHTYAQISVIITELVRVVHRMSGCRVDRRSSHFGKSRVGGRCIVSTLMMATSAGLGTNMQVELLDIRESRMGRSVLSFSVLRCFFSSSRNLRHLLLLLLRLFPCSCLCSSRLASSIGTGLVSRKDVESWRWLV